MHRILLIAACVVLTSGSTGQAQAMSAACAERDLRVIASLEERGEAGDLPANLLGELGLMQLQARLSCLGGEEMKALAIYDDVLGAARLAERVGP
jgi:hypothetical protein